MKKNGKPNPLESLSSRDAAPADFQANRSGPGRRATARSKGAPGSARPNEKTSHVDRQPDPTVSIATIERLLASDAHETVLARPTEAAPAFGAALDIDNLLHRCLNDTTFCALLLQKFVHRAGDQLSALDRAFQAGNLVELARQAHTLKGLSVNLSAGPMADCAGQLDHLTRTGELSKISPVIARMHIEVKRCLAEIPVVLARLASR